MLAAILLAVSLFIQGTASIYSAPFFILLLLFVTFGERNYNIVSVIWLFTLLSSAFFIAPIYKSGTSWAMLSMMLALPLTAIAGNRRSFQWVMIVCVIFALTLLYQYFFDPSLMYQGRRASWPLANPNNAAQIIEMALILSISKPLLFLLFFVALLTTGSIGGIVASGAGIIAYLTFKYKRLRPLVIFAGITGLTALMLTGRSWRSLSERFPIWDASSGLISFRGSGIGTFYKLYDNVRTEHTSAGMFAHNDFLQFAIEMGWPIALIFMVLCFCAARATNQHNITYACAMLAVLVHSLISFPFYIASVNVMLGIVFSQFIHYAEKRKSGGYHEILTHRYGCFVNQCLRSICRSNKTSDRNTGRGCTL